MNKSLKVLHLTAKIGFILSKVVYICCLVAGTMCLAAALALGLGVGVWELGGVSIRSIIEAEAEIPVDAMTGVTACMAILCAGEAVVAKFGELYFRRRTEDGTPFTRAGAFETIRLGIIIAAVPGSAALTASIAASALHVKDYIDTGDSSLVLGLMFVVLGLVCLCAVQTMEEKNAEAAPSALPDAVPTPGKPAPEDPGAEQGTDA